MTTIPEDTAKKILDCKEEKRRLLSNILEGEKLHTDKGYEVDSLDALKDTERKKHESQ